MQTKNPREERIMTQNVYGELLGVMKSRGGPFAGSDIPEFFALVEELFTPEEAAINNILSRKPASAVEIAERTKRSESDVRALLETMADKGLCGVSDASGARLFHGLPFMPGIFEFHFMAGSESDRDRRVAHLIHAYKKAYEAAQGVQPITYPLTRVIPVARTIGAGNVIHTYDEVVTYIDKYDSIAVGACYCRHAAKLRGEDIHGMPLDVCMWFGNIADHIIERLGGRRVTRQEARDTLDRAEEAGLIHMSRNTTEDIDFMCNCDRWHCEVVAQVLKQPKPGWVFNSGFQPVFDAARCQACGTCLDRCPSEALKMGDEAVPTLDIDRCFGCGACATGCPESAIAMEAKPYHPVPPKTVKDLVSALKSGVHGRSG
jgi:Pyruvate/2-oxoacid:ferredoxin oxidoreductase delta subunit